MPALCTAIVPWDVGRSLREATLWCLCGRVYSKHGRTDTTTPPPTGEPADDHHLTLQRRITPDHAVALDVCRDAGRRGASHATTRAAPHSRSRRSPAPRQTARRALRVCRVARWDWPPPRLDDPPTAPPSRRGAVVGARARRAGSRRPRAIAARPSLTPTTWPARRCRCRAPRTSGARRRSGSRRRR